MKSNSSRGRPIANDSSVQTLFMNMMTMHSKLVKYIQEQEDARVNYEGLQVNPSFCIDSTKCLGRQNHTLKNMYLTNLYFHIILTFKANFANILLYF